MVIDILMSSLLLVTIAFCWRLSRRVASLNSSRKELQSIIVEFDKAIVRAQSSITSLKTLTQETDEQLQKHIEKARFLTNDLAFLTHKGDNIADKLEGVVSSGKLNYLNAFGTRTPNRPSIPSQPSVTASSAPPVKDKLINRPVQAKEALHSSLGWQKTDKSPINSAQPPNREMPLSKKQALEEVLEQIAARRKTSSSPETVNIGAPSSSESKENLEKTHST